MATEDNLAFAKSVLDVDDWPRLIDRLADDAVFTVTIPDGTPISGEVRGKQAIADFLANVGDLLEFRREKPYEYYGGGERVVVVGQETVEIKKSGVTVPHSEFANVLDFREGLITRFLIIQDMSAFVDAYRDD